MIIKLRVGFTGIGSRRKCKYFCDKEYTSQLRFKCHICKIHNFLVRVCDEHRSLIDPNSIYFCCLCSRTKLNLIRLIPQEGNIILWVKDEI